MTLKKGYDTAGAKDIVQAKLNSLTFDDGSLIFEDNHLIMGDQTNMSLWGGRLGFLDVGDLIRIEEGLRHDPSWAVHDLHLFIIVPGETETAKDQRDDMIRLILNYFDDHHDLDTTGVKVYLSDNKPVQRVRVALDNDNVNKMNREWNSGALIKLELGIAKQPS